MRPGLSSWVHSQRARLRELLTGMLSDSAIGNDKRDADERMADAPAVSSSAPVVPSPTAAVLLAAAPAGAGANDAASSMAAPLVAQGTSPSEEVGAGASAEDDGDEAGGGAWLQSRGELIAVVERARSTESLRAVLLEIGAAALAADEEVRTWWGRRRINAWRRMVGDADSLAALGVLAHNLHEVLLRHEYDGQLGVVFGDTHDETMDGGEEAFLMDADADGYGGGYPYEHPMLGHVEVDGAAPSEQCERNPLCVRGYRHGGKGGMCSIIGSASQRHRMHANEASASGQSELIESPGGLDAPDATARGKIVDCRKRGRGVQYLVRFRSNGTRKWLAGRELIRFPDILAAFRDDRPDLVAQFGMPNVSGPAARRNAQPTQIGLSVPSVFSEDHCACFSWKRCWATVSCLVGL